MYFNLVILPYNAKNVNYFKVFLIKKPTLEQSGPCDA